MYTVFKPNIVVIFKMFYGFIKQKKLCISEENVDRCKDNVGKESLVFTTGHKKNPLSSSILLHWASLFVCSNIENMYC